MTIYEPQTEALRAAHFALIEAADHIRRTEGHSTAYCRASNASDAALSAAYTQYRTAARVDFPGLTTQAYATCVAYNMALPGTGMTREQRVRVAAFLNEVIHQVDIAGWSYALLTLYGIAESLGGTAEESPVWHAKIAQ
jgi:hypothetical protein